MGAVWWVYLCHSAGGKTDFAEQEYVSTVYEYLQNFRTQLTFQQRTRLNECEKGPWQTGLQVVF